MITGYNPPIKFTFYHNTLGSYYISDYYTIFKGTDNFWYIDI